jgi:hypothetical protein
MGKVIISNLARGIINSVCESSIIKTYKATIEKRMAEHHLFFKSTKKYLILIPFQPKKIKSANGACVPFSFILLPLIILNNGWY